MQPLTSALQGRPNVNSEGGGSINYDYPEFYTRTNFRGEEMSKKNRTGSVIIIIVSSTSSDVYEYSEFSL